MKRSTLVLWYASTLVLLMSAGTATAESLENQIKKIEKAYQQTASLSAEFVQTTRVEVLDKTVTRHGRFFYARGGKLRIEYSGDPMTHYISDGSHFWIWEPKAKKLDTTSLEEAGLPDEALNFLGGFGNLRDSFQITGGKDGFLKLKPQKKSSYRSLRGKFNDAGFLTDLTIHTASGNISQYRFFNLETNKPLSENLFLPPL